MSTAPQFIYSEELYRLPSRVIVLIPVPWETVPEEQVALLGKILGSVKLSLAGVQIVCHEKADIAELKVFNPSIVISFGTVLNITSERYNVSQTEGIQIIQSDPLDVLDDPKKKSLWSVLKATFAS